MIVVTYHDDLKEVQGDARLAALLGSGQARAPFDRLDWWRGLVEVCDQFPLIAVARQGNACAVLPLQRKAGQIVALGNWYNFRFAPLFTPHADRTALLTALARDLAGKARRITLSPLPDEGGETTLLSRCFAIAGWSVWREQCDVNHILQVKGRNFAEYLAARPGPLRTTLKRKAGKVSVLLRSSFDPAVWADYEAVYAASWKPEEGSPAFLRRFAQEEGAAGRLRMAVARADGGAVAAQFWTVEGNTAYIHKLAHTVAAKPLSPGTTLSAALFEQVIDRDRATVVDFGTGNDGYKRDWMEEVRPRYRLDLIQPAYPGNWPVLARHVLRRIARRG